MNANVREIKNADGKVLFSAKAFYDADLFQQACMSGVDLTGANFSGMDLSHVDLGILQVSFRDADFSNVKLEKFSCRNCDFRGVKFNRATANESSFQSCSFNWADLRYFTAADSGFVGSSFTNADFRGGTFKQCDFNSAVLEVTHLASPFLPADKTTDASFVNCNYENAKIGSGVFSIWADKWLSKIVKGSFSTALVLGGGAGGMMIEGGMWPDPQNLVSGFFGAATGFVLVELLKGKIFDLGINVLDKTVSKIRNWSTTEGAREFNSKLLGFPKSASLIFLHDPSHPYVSALKATSMHQGVTTDSEFLDKAAVYFEMGTVIVADYDHAMRAYKYLQSISDGHKFISPVTIINVVAGPKTDYKTRIPRVIHTDKDGYSTALYTDSKGKPNLAVTYNPSGIPFKIRHPDPQSFNWKDTYFMKEAEVKDAVGKFGLFGDVLANSKQSILQAIKKHRMVRGAIPPYDKATHYAIIEYGEIGIKSKATDAYDNPHGPAKVSNFRGEEFYCQGREIASLQEHPDRPKSPASLTA